MFNDNSIASNDGSYGDKIPRGKWISLISFPIAALLTYGVAAALGYFAAPGTWPYEFLFHRRFVQWVLLFTFFVGVLAVAARLPQLWSNILFSRKIRSLDDLASLRKPPPRWRQIKNAFLIRDRTALSQYLGAVKDREASEVESGYRVATDVTQVLPLMGFFGTVFGLSVGLYANFLVEGDFSTKGFATAIAIAFDNTLLGLALTILLFAFASLARKSDEAVSAKIEYFGNALLQRLCLTEAPADNEPAGVERALRTLEETGRLVIDLLPRVSTQADAMRSAMRDCCEALTRSLQEQNAAAALLLNMGEDIQKNQLLQKRLEAAVNDIPRTRDRAHNKLMQTLHSALAARNRDLLKGVSAALRQPRNIVVSDAPAELAAPQDSRQPLQAEREQFEQGLLVLQETSRHFASMLPRVIAAVESMQDTARSAGGAIEATSKISAASFGGDLARSAELEAAMERAMACLHAKGGPGDGKAAP